MTIAKYFLLKDYHLDKGPGFRLEAGTELVVGAIGVETAKVVHTFYKGSIPFPYHFHIPLQLILRKTYRLEFLEETVLGGLLHLIPRTNNE